MNHFIVERDASGMPTCLVWSPEIQRRIEQQVADEHRRQKEQWDRDHRPAPWIEDWLKSRGKSQ